MKKQFYTCDVFTDVPFGGNPLAVVTDAEGMSDAVMQAVAREFNYSETTFVLPPTRPECDVRVRIFTPTRELPFAGHPTLGTAHVLASTGMLPLKGDTTRVVLEEGVGPVHVEIETRDGQPAATRLKAAVLPEVGPTPPPATEIARAIGLTSGEIGSGALEPAAVSCGFPFLMVPLSAPGALDRAVLDAEAWRKGIADFFAPDLYLFTRDPEHPDRIHARMFGPSVGVPEDPATGSAAVTLAGYFASFDPTLRDTDDVEFSREIIQGVRMGRPSRLLIRGRKQSGVIESLEVGGATVMISEGRIEVPGL